MKIFITGVAGFLGSHLADRMLELGHEVVGNDWHRQVHRSRY
jgi:UDP-glucose 4-epimerase